MTSGDVIDLEDVVLMPPLLIPTSGSRASTQSPQSSEYPSLTHSSHSSTTPSPPDTRLTSLVDLGNLPVPSQSEFAFERKRLEAVHSKLDSNLLVAPRPHFSARTHSRPNSLTSNGSSTSISHRGGRVQLSSPHGSPRGPERMDVNGQAQEELRQESQDNSAIEGSTSSGSGLNVYSWERPLETVNRLSRMYDTSPSAPTMMRPPPSSPDRRSSRLPPTVGLLDPFGYMINAEQSPYDSALAYSSSPTHRMSQRASYYPGMSSGYPSSSSLSALSALGSVSYSGDTNVDPLPPKAPWSDRKHRSVSLGESGIDRPAIRSSMMVGSHRSVGTALSKLSGEIDPNMTGMNSFASHGIPAPEGVVVPEDKDFLNSKLYQRTLRAQKALDKERAKTANRASKVPPKFEEEIKASKSRRKSGASSVREVASISSRTSRVRRSIGSMGWFRSQSEVILSSAPATPEIPESYRSHSSVERTHLSPSPISPDAFDGPPRQRSYGTDAEVLADRSLACASIPPTPPLPVIALPLAAPPLRTIPDPHSSSAPSSPRPITPVPATKRLSAVSATRQYISHPTPRADSKISGPAGIPLPASPLYDSPSTLTPPASADFRLTQAHGEHLTYDQVSSKRGSMVQSSSLPCLAKVDSIAPESVEPVLESARPLEKPSSSESSSGASPTAPSQHSIASIPSIVIPNAVNPVIKKSKSSLFGAFSRKGSEEKERLKEQAREKLPKPIAVQNGDIYGEETSRGYDWKTPKLVESNSGGFLGRAKKFMGQSGLPPNRSTPNLALPESAAPPTPAKSKATFLTKSFGRSAPLPPLPKHSQSQPPGLLPTRTNYFSSNSHNTVPLAHTMPSSSLDLVATGGNSNEATLLEGFNVHTPLPYELSAQ